MKTTTLIARRTMLDGRADRMSGRVGPAQDVDRVAYLIGWHAEAAHTQRVMRGGAS